MGDSARARVIERHSVDDQAKRLNELFEAAAEAGASVSVPRFAESRDSL
jgi:hypothetical protein